MVFSLFAKVQKKSRATKWQPDFFIFSTFGAASTIKLAWLVESRQKSSFENQGDWFHVI